MIRIAEPRTERRNISLIAAMQTANKNDYFILHQRLSSWFYSFLQLNFIRRQLEQWIFFHHNVAGHLIDGIKNANEGVPSHHQFITPMNNRN